MDCRQVQITELPVGTWTDDYKEFLEKEISGDNGKKKKKKSSVIRDYVDMSTDRLVDITVTFAPGVVEKLVCKAEDYECNALEMKMPGVGIFKPPELLRNSLPTDSHFGSKILKHEKNM